ncbi:MAG TPA: hypothetical protein VGM53_21865 [Streptosporangiaceae bacterium]|jgi:hypothetical protein
MSESLKVGFRIEFWDNDKPGLALICEDAFLASALPRVGELVFSQIVAGITPPPWLPVPFVTVAAVEHYPVKPPDAPGVQVVIRLKAQVSRDDLHPVEEQGWTVM